MADNKVTKQRDVRSVFKYDITPDLVEHMKDDELGTYLPVHGHRLRVRQHVKKENNFQGTTKNKLLTVLHQKLEKARRKRNTSSSSEDGDEGDKSMRRPYGNKNALKGSRCIELGWIHKSHLKARQVRSRTGGGTGKVSMRKESTRDEILNQAKRLFFPNGDSPKGKLSDFDVNLWDFSERKVPDNVTLQTMYNDTMMPTLRFYLSTSDRVETGSEASTQDILSSAINISGIPIDILDDIELPDPQLEILSVPHSNPLLHIPNPPVHNVSFPDLEIETPDVPLLEYPLEFGNVLGQPLMSVPTREVTVRVHRGHILKEIIEAYKTIDPSNDKIAFEFAMPNGVVEVAADGRGVTRDASTEFWREFYDQCTLGTCQKVPFLRHDFGEHEWQAIANVIVFGWNKHGYFPIQLSLPFVQQCLFSHVSVDLLDAFYRYVPEQESLCLKNSIKDFADVAIDKLVDILDGHDVRKQPTESNIVKLVQEVDHKELIQTPMFVADVWNSILKDIDITENQLAELYNNLNPTPRGICKALVFPDNMNTEESTVSNHLKRFIRELNEDNLRKCVRYCTGSDLLVTHNISIAFVNTSGLARRPVAHTCTSMLELSKNYDRFPQFRAEFMGILESNVWVMDIV